MNIPVVIFLILLAIVIGYVLGHIEAVAEGKRQHRKIMMSMSHLEESVAMMNDQFKTDPMRAAIDTGQAYAVNQMQTLLNKLKEEIE